MVKHVIENGVYAAALTPLKRNLKCDDELLAEHCKELLERGCKGVVLFGTTGEGPSFSTAEKKKILKKVIARGVDPKKIMVGNGSACIHDTVALAKDALEYGCLASLIAPPCFYKNVKDTGVISFYREIIKRVKHPDLQILLYHIPQFSGVPITVHTVKTLCNEFPGIVVGMKESESNLALTKEVLQEVPQCRVFVGKEKQIPEALPLGISGAICGMGNLYPELLCFLFEKGSSSEIEKIDAAFVGRPFIASAKAILARKNPKWKGFVMPPLVPISKEETLDLLSKLQK
jgi:4-hydroxy-tetrahydrodipicolinate synthase